MIEFEEVTKVYGLTAALSDVTMKIGKGCNGLLGPNGSGKTTSLKLIVGMIRPDKGSVMVFGENPFNNPDVASRIGYSPEFDEPYPWMTARKYLDYMLSLHGYGSNQRKRRIREVIEMLGMEKYADRAISGYSKGMLQKVKIAQAIIHDPPLVLLDEPMNGLDPIWRGRVLNLIKRWKKEGKTVVYSTHLLFEAEKVCNKVYFMYRGTLIASGEISELRERLSMYPHRVLISVNDKFSTLLKTLVDTPYISQLAVKKRNGEKGEIEVETVDPKKLYRELPRILADLGIPIDRVESVDDNLDTIYRYVLELVKEG